MLLVRTYLFHFVCCHALKNNFKVVNLFFLHLVASARVEPEIHWSKHLNQCLGRPQEMFECVVERSEVCSYIGAETYIILMGRLFRPYHFNPKTTVTIYQLTLTVSNLNVFFESI